MGKKLQGAKLRAVKRSKLALEELQERQAEDAIVQQQVEFIQQQTDDTTSNNNVIMIDRMGTNFVPHHLRPSKQLPHKRSSSSSTTTTNSNTKFQKKLLSSIDEQKVQKILLQQQKQKQSNQQKDSPTINVVTVVTTDSSSSSSSTARSRNSNTTTRRLIKTTIRRDTIQPQQFDLWGTATSAAVAAVAATATVAAADSSMTHVVNSGTSDTTSSSSTGTQGSSIGTGNASNFLTRTVKLTAERIRNVVVSTATIMKDTILNYTLTQTAPAGIAPIHTVTKAVPFRKSIISSSTATTAITKGLPIPKGGTNTGIASIKKCIANTKNTIAIDTSLTGGQSYHPDPIQHQTLIQKAIDIEIQRNRYEQEMDTPISTGLSETTRALLVRDDSDDSDDEETNNNNIDANQSMAVGDIPKRLNKITKAKRNKMKEHKRREYEIQLIKKQKQQYNDSEIPKYKKDIKRQEQISQSKQLQKIQHIQTKIQTPVGSQMDLHIPKTTKSTTAKNSGVSTILSKPTVPVALTTEASSSSSSSSSLRTIQPKGSMMIDRAYSFSIRHPSISPLIPTKRSHNTMKKNLDTTVVTNSNSNNNNNKIMIKAPHKHRKKRKLSLKGKRNTVTRGDTFEILG